MPLLNGRPLDLHNYTRRLDDDDEVFYCELTNEIFEDYEEFCERMLVCGSLLWSCAITGKNGLTYQEALESEQNALKNIKDLAPELRTPVLYLAYLTERKTFSELADDVFNFVKDRFFLNESVQVCFEEGIWSYGQVKQVLLPKPDEIEKYVEENDVDNPIHCRPYPAPLYKYKIEELIDELEGDDEEPECQIIRTCIFSGDQVRRLKGIYSKDKNRVYLKQFTEQKKSENWIVKSSIINKYAINTLQFHNLFVGETPVFLNKPNVVPPFRLSTKITKTSPKNEKLTQQSMKKFLTPVSTDKQSGNKSLEKKSPPKKSASLEAAKKIQKKYVATIERVVKSGKKEEVIRVRMEELRKKREEKRNEREKLASFAKEWQRKREDLECEDLIELPQACSVDCKIPNSLFGDFLMILEFFNCFRETLNVKNYFPNGLTFDLLERALVDVEIAGPFADMLQLLLVSLFELQDQEDDEVKHRKASAIIALNENENLTTHEAVKLATLAARWSKTYQNAFLNQLQLDAVTVTDILRLHLLSSGGRAGEISAKWRFQERGGYCSTDDPGLEFRISEPHIFKHLATDCVATLDVADKIKVINCLTSQILTYATIRDVMDEKIEKVAVGRKELKNCQIADNKREKERVKERKQGKEKGEQINVQADEQSQTEKKKSEYCKRWAELQEAAMTFQLAPLGRDRGHRRYWIFSSLPGLFVEDDERWPGHCLPQPTMINKTAVAVHDDDTMTYIRNLFEVGRNSTGSDKENDSDTNMLSGTPKKKLFGENGLSLSPNDHKTVKVNENNGIVCAAQEDVCLVHNPSIERTRWQFYYREEEINDLIKALNKRGYRENHLRTTLISEKSRIMKHVEKCTIHKLNRFIPMIQEPITGKVSTRRVKGYDDANLGYPAGTPIEKVIESHVRGVILDTEAKIHGGGLGVTKVSDRKSWRDLIENFSYDSFDPHLTWPTKLLKDKEVDDHEETASSRPDSPCSMHSDSEIVVEIIKPEQNSTVRDMAMAVLQLARSVEPKYLKKPLPYEEKRPVALTVMERWEFALMQSTSLTQVYLHLSSLENSIQWNKSVLNARCKICRRGRDDVNMLLCDGCNSGFHLYCLKPKLSSIPQDDWFCSTCRPKEIKTHSRSRRRFIEDEEPASCDSDDVPLVKRRSSKRARDISFDEPRAKKIKAS